MQAQNKLIETMKLLDEESILNRIYRVRVFLLILLVGMVVGCDINEPKTEAQESVFTFVHRFSHIFPQDVTVTADIGIWMFQNEEKNVDSIANWLGLYTNPETLEPINVLWIDFNAENQAEARANVEEFLISCNFPIRLFHSNGYSGLFGENTWIDQSPTGIRAYSDALAIEDNNHGRIFSAFLPPDGALRVYLTTGAFSREEGVSHHYISFNQARDALTQEDCNDNWQDLGVENDWGNIINNANYTTRDHTGVRVFALYDKCAGFPPLGETLTFRIVGTSLTFSVFSEEVTELVAGYEVYRLSRSDNPIDLGQYFACDPDEGDIAVATDWWELGNPSNNGRDFYEPPLSLPCIVYGATEGTKCEWVGTLGGRNESESAEVVGYETITVPYGTFENAMKVRDTAYGDDGDLLWDNYLWIDKNIRLLRAEDVDGGDAIELINYTPPSSNLGKKVGFTGLGIYRNLSINFLNKKTAHEDN